MLSIVNSAFYSSMVRSWLGQLKLCFELRYGRSVLTKLYHRGPFYVQKPFYYEDEVPHVYLLHPPGGLVGGDYLSLNVDLASGSQVLLTMPGASKFYRSNGAYVYLQQKFNLEEDSILEWLPQSNIFFSHSKVIIDSILTIAKGARCIFFEMLCFGYSSVNRRFTNGVLNIFLSVSLNNFPVLKERIRMDSSDDCSFYKFGGYQIGAIFFAIPSNVQILNDVRIIIQRNNVGVGGATLLDSLLIVRLLGNNNERMQNLLRELWCFLRPIIIGKQPVIPRVWLT